MDVNSLLDCIVQVAESACRGRILVVADDPNDFETYSSSFRREGFEVRTSVSYPEGLSCLESERFDLVIVKLREIPGLEDEESWSVRSRSPAAGLSWYWHAVSIGVATLLWCAWEVWTN